MCVLARLGAPVAADLTLVSQRLCCFQTDIFTELYSYHDHLFQLKSDNSVVSGGQSDQVAQVLQIPVDQKISAAHEITKPGPERMIPTQQVEYQ